MADTPRKTYPELDTQTGIQDTDLLASYREPGPLKGLPAGDVLSYIDAGIQPSVEAAQTAATDAEGWNALAQAAASQAEFFAGEALAASLAAGFYPAANSYVPRGVLSAAIGAAGSGGVDGTYLATYSGGNFSVNPQIQYTVSGGAITAVEVQGPGLYIGASPTAPTVSVVSSSVVGATINLTVGFLAGSGEFYWTDHLTDTSLAQLYQNVSGVATIQTGETFPKIVISSVVPCTVGGSANAITMTPVSGFSVSAAGVNQEFTGIAQGGNSSAGLTVAISGVNAGAATQVLLPSGNTVPANALKTNYPFRVRWDSAISKYVLTAPTYVPEPSFVLLEWMSGTGNTISAKVAHADYKLPAAFDNVRFAFQAQADKPFGSPSLTIYANDGVTVLLGATAIYDKTNTAPVTEAAFWKAKQWVEVTRLTTGHFIIYETPNTALTIATEQDAALAVQNKTVQQPIFAEKVTERTWIVDVGAIQYDDTSLATSKKMNQDKHRVIMYDAGRAMSQGVLQCSYAPALITNIGYIGGKEYEYCNLYSDEVGGGAFQGDQPSTCEYAFQVGLYANASNTYDFEGLFHGLLQTVSSTLTIGASPTDHKADSVGTRLRGTSFVWNTTYDVFRGPVGTPTRIGQVNILHTIDANGATVQHIHRVGRTMSYTSGNADPAIGATITGQTSGATATLVVDPVPTTGSYGAGTAAGDWYVSGVVGTFQNGENLRIGGVTVAVMNGTIGAQIGVDNSYAAMMPTTTINRYKVPNYPEIVVGYQDDVQQPTGLPGATWPGQDRMQTRHGVIDTDVIFEMLLLGNEPLDPPGNYSLCATSQMFVQDRAEGNRKGYANWVSGNKQVFEGTYTGQQRYRFRVGSLV